MQSKSPRRPSTKRFNQAPQANIPRSTFDLSYPYKTTFDSGYLIPLKPEEVLPGDSFRYRVYGFARQATPLHPTLDNLYMETFFFFVPNRLVWDNWQRFMGEQDNPGDSTDYQVPVVSGSGSIGTGDLADYFGLPLGGIYNNIIPNALPFRAMNLIWNEWFRDENLQDSVNVPKGDGPDSISVEGYQVLRRGKRKDYISSSLPWPQKGPGVELPLGTSAPVIANLADPVPEFRGANAETTDRTMQINGLNVEVSPGGGSGTVEWAEGFKGSTQNPQTGLLADLSAAIAPTVGEFRTAMQISKLLERDARGGTRYTEILRSHFRVISPDSRLQRPEYLGGGHSAIQMNVVPQTSETQAGTPQGNLSAFGTVTTTNHGFTKSFVEHGWIIPLVNVRADLNYQNRLDRMWSRRTKYDYYWPALQALGEQAVLNKEVWSDGTAADNDVWGYQERWAEYRQNLGCITGLFRSDAAGTLDPWHYALDYDTRPALDETFVQDNPPVQRTIAVQDEPEFLFDAWVDIKAARPMPIYSVPGYVDHF